MKRRFKMFLGSGFVVAALVAATQAAGGQNGARTAVKPQPGQFSGKTSQRWALSFKVSADGKSIRPFATSITVVCRISGTYPDTKPFRPPGAATIRSDGTFKRNVSPGDGTTYTYQGRFTGSGAATGTLKLFSSKLAYGGIEVCATPGGSARWQASRR